MSPSTLIFIVCAFSTQIRRMYNDNPTIAKTVFDRVQEILKELYDAEIISYEIKDLLHDLSCVCYESMLPFEEN